MNISLERYRVFYTVAKHLSFSKAAIELYISQSAVSQSVKSLESALGYPLFIRSNKKIILTIDGTLLYSYLEQAMTLIYAAEHRLKHRQDPYQGELTIAATDTLCKYFLLPKIKEFKAANPAIKINILNNTSLQNITLLKKAKVDLALLNLPNNLDTDKFTIQKEYTFQDVFVADTSLQLPEKMSLQQISKQTLLMLDNLSVTRAYFEELFTKKNIPFYVEFELQNIHILIDMAKAGLGVTYVPDYCLDDNSLQKIQLTSTIPQRKYGILSLSQLPLVSVAQTFLDML